MTEPTLCAICHQPAHRYGIPDPEHEYDAMGCVNMLLPALDLERNRADEAVAERDAAMFRRDEAHELAQEWKLALRAAEAEVARLQAVVHDIRIARLEALRKGQTLAEYDAQVANHGV